MTATSASAPKLAQFDPYYPKYYDKIVMMVNLSLKSSAAFLVQRSNFTATPSANSGVPMYIGPLTVTNRSTFAFRSCSWSASTSSGYSIAFYLSFSPATITNSSQWTFTSCSWSASAPSTGSTSYAFYMYSSPVITSSESYWSVVNGSLMINAFRAASLNVTIVASTQLMFTQSTLTCIRPPSACTHSR